MTTPSRHDLCPNPTGRHLYGASKCLVCESPAPRKRRVTGRLRGEDVDRKLRARPGAFCKVGPVLVQNDGIEDVAGWGEDGDPWTS